MAATNENGVPIFGTKRYKHWLAQRQSNVLEKQLDSAAETPMMEEKLSLRQKALNWFKGL